MVEGSGKPRGASKLKRILVMGATVAPVCAGIILSTAGSAAAWPVPPGPIAPQALPGRPGGPPTDPGNFLPTNPSNCDAISAGGSALKTASGFIPPPYSYGVKGVGYGAQGVGYLCNKSKEPYACGHNPIPGHENTFTETMQDVPEIMLNWPRLAGRLITGKKLFDGPGCPA